MIEPIKIPQKINQVPNGQEIYTNPKTQKQDNNASAFSAFKEMKQQRYADIYDHECKHKSAGGAQAGGINIITDSNGVATEGFVPIQLPGLDPKKPEETVKMAEIAYNSATAPGGDMSAQDHKVAGDAMSRKSMGQNALSKRDSIFNQINADRSKNGQPAFTNKEKIDPNQPANSLNFSG